MLVWSCIKEYYVRVNTSSWNSLIKKKIKFSSYIWLNICAFPHILVKLPHIWLCNRSCLNFLMYCLREIYFYFIPHPFFSSLFFFFFYKIKKGKYNFLFYQFCVLLTCHICALYVPPYYGSHCSLIHDPTVRGDGAHQERRRKARELDWTKCCPAWPTVTERQTETEAILEA